jgi:hypothetical protein
VTPYGYDARRDACYATTTSDDWPQWPATWVLCGPLTLPDWPETPRRRRGPVIARVEVPAPGMRPARCTRPGPRPRGYQARRMIA